MKKIPPKETPNVVHRANLTKKDFDNFSFRDRCPRFWQSFAVFVFSRMQGVAGEGWTNTWRVKNLKKSDWARGIERSGRNKVRKRTTRVENWMTSKMR